MEYAHRGPFIYANEHFSPKANERRAQAGALPMQAKPACRLAAPSRGGKQERAWEGAKRPNGRYKKSILCRDVRQKYTFAFKTCKASPAAWSRRRADERTKKKRFPSEKRKPLHAGMRLFQTGHRTDHMKMAAAPWGSLGSGVILPLLPRAVPHCGILPVRRRSHPAIPAFSEWLPDFHLLRQRYSGESSAPRR